MCQLVHHDVLPVVNDPIAAFPGVIVGVYGWASLRTGGRQGLLPEEGAEVDVAQAGEGEGAHFGVLLAYAVWVLVDGRLCFHGVGLRAEELRGSFRDRKGISSADSPELEDAL